MYFAPTHKTRGRGLLEHSAAVACPTLTTSNSEVRKMYKIFWDKGMETLRPLRSGSTALSLDGG
jgi:hypothetical protein